MENHARVRKLIQHVLTTFATSSEAIGRFTTAKLGTSLPAIWMARYLARACPRCNRYLGLTMRESPTWRPVQALKGQCVRCGHWFAWIVISGSGSASSDAWQAKKETRIYRGEVPNT